MFKANPNLSWHTDFIFGLILSNFSWIHSPIIFALAILYLPKDTGIIHSFVFPKLSHSLSLERESGLIPILFCNQWRTQTKWRLVRSRDFAQQCLICINNVYFNQPVRNNIINFSVSLELKYSRSYKVSRTWVKGDET